ncbi:MAG: aldo/keto reductase [Clostridiales bacterium]|nr:aldo/keto reductase [Clostridiales bacterium]
MDKRVLGSDLEVSAIGLGCMGFSHAYGAPVPEQETIQMLRYAYELGYTFFDTAEIYGTPGDPNANERVVGEALQPIRNHVKIASKFGIRFDYDSPQVNKPLIPDSRPEVIRASVEGSLKRLRTDYIDLYFQHRIDPAVEPETVAEVMGELVKEGKILHWGISEANEAYLRRAHAVCPVTAVQNRYSMMARFHEALFPVVEELGIGFVAFSPMANGFLTGKYGKDAVFDRKYDYRSGMPQFTPETVDVNRELLAMLNAFAEEYHATAAQVSMAWMLCKKPWIVPIPGTRKADRLQENAGAAKIHFSATEVEKLDRLLDQLPMSEVFGGSRVSNQTK